MTPSFHFYIGAEVEIKLHEHLSGPRELLNINERLSLFHVRFFNQDKSDYEDYWVNQTSCQIILRSINEDITEREEQELKAMNFSFSYPKQIIMDGDSTYNRNLSVVQMAPLFNYLTRKFFSIGILPKNSYIIRNTRKS